MPLAGTEIARPAPQFRTASHASLPLRGRHAFDMAAGQLASWLDRVLGVVAAEILAYNGAAKLACEHRQLVMPDMAQGRAYFTFTFSLENCKVGSSFRCSWPDYATATSRSLLSDALDGDHLLARQVCIAGSAPRQQLMQFACGVSLIALPDLIYVVGPLRCLSIIERHTEGQHARIHGNISADRVPGPFIWPLPACNFLRVGT